MITNIVSKASFIVISQMEELSYLGNPKSLFSILSPFLSISSAPSLYIIETRPIPARSCGAGVKDCRVKELDLI